MIKQKFESLNQFIDHIWGDEDGQFTLQDDNNFMTLYHQDHSRIFGFEFKGKDSITNNPDDEGEWAGKDHYEIFESAYFPKEFPCVLVIEECVTDSFSSKFVYLSDFK